MNFSIVVAHAKDNVDRATVSLTLANAALEHGHKVRVVLTCEAVRLTVRGYALDMNDEPPFLPVHTLMEHIQAKGGQFFVCTSSMMKRALQKDDMIDGVHFADAAGIVKILAEADRTIQI